LSQDLEAKKLKNILENTAANN
jgi:hypothetical protein